MYVCIAVIEFSTLALNKESERSYLQIARTITIFLNKFMRNKNRPLSLVVKTLQSVPEVWGSIPGLVMSDPPLRRFLEVGLEKR